MFPTPAHTLNLVVVAGENTKLSGRRCEICDVDVESGIAAWNKHCGQNRHIKAVADKAGEVATEYPCKECGRKFMR